MSRSTRRFFTAEGVGHYRIVESAGATEGAPAAGTADIIVDITTTGATLDSNGLKILRDGLILAQPGAAGREPRGGWPPEALRALENAGRESISNGGGQVDGFDLFAAVLKAR